MTRKKIKWGPGNPLYDWKMGKKSKKTKTRGASMGRKRKGGFRKGRRGQGGFGLFRILTSAVLGAGAGVAGGFAEDAVIEVDKKPIARVVGGGTAGGVAGFLAGGKKGAIVGSILGAIAAHFGTQRAKEMMISGASGTKSGGDLF